MTSFTPNTPAALGYRLAAEWEPHAATWLSWPHNVNSWPGKFEPVPAQFAEFARAVARFEPVHVLAGGEEIMSQARRHLEGTPNLTLHDIPTNDAWCRDHGPMFLTASESAKHLPPALVDWEYNAWGGKYPPFDLDNAVPEKIAALQGRKRFVPGMVLEGGAIDTNGQGTILTTETCLLNPTRNPGMSREAIEQTLRDYTAATHFVWLGGEIEGDDTDGHIDQLARFVGPRTIVAPRERDASEANHAPLEANWERLQSARDQDGAPFELHALPMPRPKYHNGQRLPMGYANFYIANGVVAVPQYGDPADEEACEVLRPLFPNREVIGLPAIDLIWGLGAFHCLAHEETK